MEAAALPRPASSSQVKQLPLRTSLCSSRRSPVLLSCLQDKDSGNLPSLQLQLRKHKSFANTVSFMILQVRHSASTHGASQVGGAMPEEGVSFRYTAQRLQRTALHRPQATLVRKERVLRSLPPSLGLGARGSGGLREGALSVHALPSSPVGSTFVLGPRQLVDEVG